MAKQNQLMALVDNHSAVRTDMRFVCADTISGSFRTNGKKAVNLLARLQMIRFYCRLGDGAREREQHRAYELNANKLH